MAPFPANKISDWASVGSPVVNAAASNPGAPAAATGATAIPPRASARLWPLTAAVACDSKLTISPPADNAFATALPLAPVAFARAIPFPKILRKFPFPPSAVALAFAIPAPTEVAVAVVLPPNPPGPELDAPPLPPVAVAAEVTVPTPVEVADARATAA